MALNIDDQTEQNQDPLSDKAPQDKAPLKDASARGNVTLKNKKTVKPIPAKAPKSKSSRAQSLAQLDDQDYVYNQLHRVLYALDAFKKGDVSVRLQKEDDDIFAEIAEAYNSMVEMIGGVGGEVSRISKVAGVEGNLSARASAANASGFW
ncbi:MAG TPA: hypothetical protein VF691_09930, partial [Cytophagaceae bacterium]